MKNLHIEHIEEVMLFEGVNGARKAVNIMRAFRDGNLQMSIKWDGAPAFVAGIHPDTKRFFVATKSFFNKVPKINYTDEDIDRNHPKPGLNHVLKKLLRHLPKLQIKGIVQGDFLFENNELRLEKFSKWLDSEEENYITFQPNVIKYAVPTSSDASRCINAYIGVAIHTAYDENMNFVPVALGETYQPTVEVWVAELDADMPKMDRHEKHNLQFALRSVGESFQKIPKEAFEAFINDKESRINFKKVINYHIRQGEDIRDLTFNIPKEHGGELYMLLVALSCAKMYILKKMRETQSIRCFIGDKETGHEGYVVSTAESLIKIVDRSEFSFFNFQARDVNINKETWQL